MIMLSFILITSSVLASRKSSEALGNLSESLRQNDYSGRIRGLEACASPDPTDIWEEEYWERRYISPNLMSMDRKLGETTGRKHFAS